LSNSYPTNDILFDDFVATTKAVSGIGLNATPSLPVEAVAIPADATVSQIKDPNGTAQTNTLFHDPNWKSGASLMHKGVFLNASRITHR
jgi:hypothetical protein